MSTADNTGVQTLECSQSFKAWSPDITFNPRPLQKISKWHNYILFEMYDDKNKGNMKDAMTLTLSLARCRSITYGSSIQNPYCGPIQY